MVLEVVAVGDQELEAADARDGEGAGRRSGISKAMRLISQLDRVQDCISSLLDIPISNIVLFAQAGSIDENEQSHVKDGNAMDELHALRIGCCKIACAPRVALLSPGQFPSLEGN